MNSKSEEGIIRLCLKLLISLIFKGQSPKQAGEFFKNGASLSEFESLFRQQGITEQGEMMKILQSFHLMIKQIHNFEIARIHQESYVQYL